MSYDVGFVIDVGAEELHEIGENYNYTYNCAPMFRLALGGDGIHDLNDLQCSVAIPRLEAAVAHITGSTNAAEYAAMNPPNGWGDHVGAQDFLKKILAGCQRHPKAFINVC